MTKRMILILPLLLVCLLTGCATTDAAPLNTIAPLTTASDGPGTLPQTTDETVLLPDGNLPQTTGVPSAAGVSSIPAARRYMEQIENELERLSEVTDAQVVLAGTTAAVALQFDRQYRTGIDDRLQRMVEERIHGVVSGIDHVVVTAEPSLYDALEALGSRMEDAADFDAIRNDLMMLVNQIQKA